MTRSNRTIVCGVSGTPECGPAVRLAAVLSRRLRARLVLAHIVPGFEVPGADNLPTRPGYDRAVALLDRVARETGLEDATCRAAVGDPARRLAQIAAEENADLILIGSHPRGMFRRGLESRLARKLELETPCPVLIAPPQTNNWSEQRVKLMHAKAS